MPLALAPSIGLWIAALGLIVWGRWRQNRYSPGRSTSIVSPMLMQLVGFVVLIVVSAHIVSVVTGVSWTPPRRGF